MFDCTLPQQCSASARLLAGLLATRHPLAYARLVGPALAVGEQCHAAGNCALIAALPNSPVRDAGRCEAYADAAARNVLRAVALWRDAAGPSGHEAGPFMSTAIRKLRRFVSLDRAEQLALSELIARLSETPPVGRAAGAWGLVAALGEAWQVAQQRVASACGGSSESLFVAVTRARSAFGAGRGAWPPGECDAVRSADSWCGSTQQAAEALVIVEEMLLEHHAIFAALAAAAPAADTSAPECTD
jgi:hypothetical protein